MAIWLFKKARGAIREHQAKKAVPTTDDSHLVPEAPTSHTQYSTNGTEPSPPRVSHNGKEHERLSAVEKAEARQRNLRQWKLLIGLLLPNFLAAVDVTIVAPAIPLISSDFSLSLLNLHYHHALTDLQTVFLGASTGSSRHTP